MGEWTPYIYLVAACVAVGIIYWILKKSRKDTDTPLTSR